MNILEFRNKIESIESYDFVCPSTGVYIYGAGNLGKKVANVLLVKGVLVLGFFDKNPKQDSICGVPVYSVDRFPFSGLEDVFVAVLNRSAPLKEILDFLLMKGVIENKIFMPWHYYDAFRTELGWQLWLESPVFYKNNLSNVLRSYEMMTDLKSQQLFLKMVLFRAGEDISYSSYCDNIPQYFNELTFSDSERCNDAKLIYVDAGAYDGDSFLDLRDYCPRKNIVSFLFEPDASNYNRLISNTISISECYRLPFAVSDSHQMLTFSSGNGEGSSISCDGNVHVTSISLDDFFSDKGSISFIKMDIEGAELNALKGASKIISESRPTIALSLYHNPNDIWSIPFYLKENFPFYKFYIRQHMYNSFENVLYCIPE